MRLAFFNPTGILGGAEMCLLDLLAALRRDRPDWSLQVLLGDEGPLVKAVEEAGAACDVLPLPAGLAGLGDAGLSRAHGGRRLTSGLALALGAPSAALSTVAYLARLRRWLRQARPDRLQTNGMKAHLLGTWAAPKTLPVVWHMHDFAGGRALMARLLRRSARGRKNLTVVGVSQAVAGDAGKVLGPEISVRSIYNAVDLDRFRPGPGDGEWLDREAGLAPAPERTVRIGLVGTYARWKGHDVFLDAAAQVPADLPARFYIVGGPLYRSAGSQFGPEELAARARALGLEAAGRVGFVPHQPAPEAVFRALDVVVHASTRPEPFGRVIVEAMACGRPVIASRAGGAAELFEDGETAMGCPPGDPQALAGAMARLAADPGLRARLGEAGRSAAAERFDRGRLAGEWSEVYEDADGPARAGLEAARAGASA
ncbi:MAG: glycosyltransferase family 4 protein [Isosphaeraceae bacterium]